MSQSKGLDLRAIDDMKKNRQLAIGVAGFIAMILGLFLPWYEASIFGQRVPYHPGLNSTGLLIAIVAIVGAGAALNVLGKDFQQMRTVAIVTAVMAALIILSNYPDGELGNSVSVGLGYWLGLLGAGAALYGSISNNKTR